MLRRNDKPREAVHRFERPVRHRSVPHVIDVPTLSAVLWSYVYPHTYAFVVLCRLYKERLSQVDIKLQEVIAGNAAEYLEPLANLQENMQIRTKVAGTADLLQ